MREIYEDSKMTQVEEKEILEIEKLKADISKMPLEIEKALSIDNIDRIKEQIGWLKVVFAIFMVI
ncbi:MAG: hypothetical protein SPLUMA2_SPLUMAMAG2_01795 [uncultured Sulfurimonas sp.]|nr:MAG: hypothetical protein SPLUMA1_SPLUMAMAG1_01913 [uncultured Sulfurimonas sp.]CAI6150647.1 MAG: hypothetical protein SPLUMA2_SPLUMAMAG2_01795 [uncultured Sulfurimonas sp.]